MHATTALDGFDAAEHAAFVSNSRLRAAIERLGRALAPALEAAEDAEWVDERAAHPVHAVRAHLQREYSSALYHSEGRVPPADSLRLLWANLLPPTEGYPGGDPCVVPTDDPRTSL